MVDRRIRLQDVEALLLELGFARIETAGMHRGYTHHATDTVVLLPPPEQENIDSAHLVAVRKILDGRGVIDADEFDRVLQRRTAGHAAR